MISFRFVVAIYLSVIGLVSRLAVAFGVAFAVGSIGS